MNNEEFLKELSAKLESGEISRQDVMSRLNLASVESGEYEPREKKRELLDKFRHVSAAKILYVLGGVMVLSGVSFLMALIWNDIGSAGRILVTLGLGLLFAGMGSVFMKQRPQEMIGPIFHFIGGMLIPGGAVVTLSELGDRSDSFWPLAITFGVVFSFYLLLTLVHKHPILTFFALANGTAFIYLFTEATLGLDSGDLYAYLTMIVGASYLILGRSFREGWNKGLTGFLYLAGIVSVLGAAFTQVIDSLPWQLIYFLVVSGGFYLSVYLKSRVILVMSMLFLVGHFVYLTGAYFADSIGWPFAIIILGFIFIALGYASIAINKKYIKKVS